MKFLPSALFVFLAWFNAFKHYHVKIENQERDKTLGISDDIPEFPHSEENIRMMKMAKIGAIIEGGKATPAPPLGPALSPLKVNVVKIIAEINAKTEAFKGMQVPITIHVDEKTKDFRIEVGSPPVSSMLKKEAKVSKLAGLGKEESGRPAPVVGNVTIEQVIKIAKSKDNIAGNLKSKVKQVVGSCKSCGINVDGKNPKDVEKEIAEGKYDDKIQ